MIIADQKKSQAMKSGNCISCLKVCLHLHEELLWNDCFVVALDVVLRNGAVVYPYINLANVPELCNNVTKDQRGGQSVVSYRKNGTRSLCRFYHSHFHLVHCQYPISVFMVPTVYPQSGFYPVQLYHHCMGGICCTADRS